MAGGRLRKFVPKMGRGKGLNPKQKKQVKSAITRSGEKKHFSTIIDTTASDVVTALALSPITQSTTGVSRTGDSVHPTLLELNLKVEAADVTNVVRLTLVQWKNNSLDDAIDATDIYTNTTTDTAPMSTLNFVHRSQYKVLADRFVALNIDGEGVRVVKFRIREKQMLDKIMFNPVTTTGANLFYLLIWFDSGLTVHPTIIGQSRLFYTDN